MPADEYRSELRALGKTVVVAMAMMLGSDMATARDADPERELHKLDRSLRDSETRREHLRRRANRTANEIADLKHRLVVAARRYDMCRRMGPDRNTFGLRTASSGHAKPVHHAPKDG